MSFNGREGGHPLLVIMWLQTRYQKALTVN